MGRAPCCDKASVKKGPWSPEEDAKLKAYIEENGMGGNWIALPHKIGLKRCGKSCRLRWLNYLRPNIKHGGFSEEEDNIISSLYISIGSRWSIIAAQLPGRTDNDIKNYWNTRLKKKLLGKRKEMQNRGLSPSNEEQSSTGNDVNSEATDSSQARLSTSALERLQLHMQLGGLNSLSLFHNPAMWPYKLIHPDLLGHGVGQGQHDAAISADSAAQHAHPFGRPANKMSSQEPAFASNSEISGCIISGNNILGELDGSSCLSGLPSLSSPAAFNTEQSNASLNPSDGSDQADFSDLFCGKNGGFESEGLPAAPPLGDLDCFNELVGTNEGTVWWAGSCFEEEKSSCSWGSASAVQPPTMMFQPQDYALGYDC